MTVLLFGVLAYAVSVYSQRQGGMTAIKMVSLPVLPTLMSLGMALTQYYFPNLSAPFRFVLWGAHFLLLYAVFLAENIFSVSLTKSIPLFRAARTVSFLATILASLFLFTAVYKFSSPFWLQAGVSVLFSILLAFQFLWLVDLKPVFDRRVLAASLFLGLVVGESALGLSFLPLKSFFRSVSLSTVLYICLGIAQRYFQHSLTDRVVWEYAVMVGIVGLFLSGL